MEVDSRLKILGIESSCDETAAAVVEDGSRILSSVVASQLDTHGKYGGVVPELASREHLRAIVPVVREALERAGCAWPDLAAVAVTAGPGLVGSLLVGVTYAKAIAYTRGLPLIAVNHIEGHIHAVLSQNNVDLPALAYVVSGGHTHLFEIRAPGEYKLLGRTRDDAAGEAYDKVAKLLGYGYPGGPTVDRLAAHGDPNGVKFTMVKMKGNTLDTSFSGLKTAVLRWTENAAGMAEEIANRRTFVRENPHPSIEQWLTVTPRRTLDLLASFQRTVIQELLRRTAAAAEEINTRSILFSGGVACNAGLRAAAPRELAGYPVYFPAFDLSTDNAAMIAAAAWPKFLKNDFADFNLKASASLAIA